MKPITKLALFWPQFAWLTLSTTAWTTFTLVRGAALVPIIVVGSVTGLVTLVTSIKKSVWFLDNGWPEPEECSSCARLTHELTETREALATLNAED
jgi:hypothetical protein